MQGYYKQGTWIPFWTEPWEDMTDEEVIAFYRGERSRDWMIAALIDGSIGYHTYGHAEKIVGEYDEGKTKDYCERCGACYGYDLIKMLASDVRQMLWKESHDPGKVQRLVAFVRALAPHKDDDWGFGMTVSMAYPTMAV